MKLYYSPVRINQGQQQEIIDIFTLLDEDKQLIMRMTLDVLGWEIIKTKSNRSGFRLERQS